MFLKVDDIPLNHTNFSNGLLAVNEGQNMQHVTQNGSGKECTSSNKIHD